MEYKGYFVSLRHHSYEDFNYTLYILALFKCRYIQYIIMFKILEIEINKPPSNKNQNEHFTQLYVYVCTTRLRGNARLERKCPPYQHI